MQSKSVDWFLHGSSCCWGYFQTDYNTVLFLEAAIEGCPSVIIAVAGLILVGWQTVSLRLYLRMSSFADVFILFFCTFLQEHPYIIAPGVCSLEYLLTKEGFTLVASFKFSTYFNSFAFVL